MTYFHQLLFILLFESISKTTPAFEMYSSHLKEKLATMIIILAIIALQQR